MNFHLCSFTGWLLYNVKKRERLGLSGAQTQRHRTLNLILNLKSKILSVLLITPSLLQYCIAGPSRPNDLPTPGSALVRSKPMKVRPGRTLGALIHKRMGSAAGLLPLSAVWDVRGWTDALWCPCDLRAPVFQLSLHLEYVCLPYLVLGFHCRQLRPSPTHPIPANLFRQGWVLFLQWFLSASVCPLCQRLVLELTQINSLDLAVTDSENHGLFIAPEAPQGGPRSGLTLDLWFRPYLTRSAWSGPSLPLHVCPLAVCSHTPPQAHWPSSSSHCDLWNLVLLLVICTGWALCLMCSSQLILLDLLLLIIQISGLCHFFRRTFPDDPSLFHIPLF